MSLKKRLSALLMAAVMLFIGTASFMFVFADEGDENSIGAGLTWTYSSSSNTVQISGNGNMADFDVSGPWSADFSEQITTVVIDEGVRTIGANAFAGLTQLKYITIPHSVIRIAGSAFKQCQISTFKVDSSNTYFSSITSNVHGDCGLYNNDKTEIVRFATLSTIKKFNIPSTVTVIGDYAFESATFTEISLPAGLTEIGEHAFENSALTGTVNFPTTLVKIDDYAFEGCGKVTVFDFRENGFNLVEIGDRAFENCTSLTKVDHLYNSVNEVGELILEGDVALKEIYFYGKQTEWNALNIYLPSKDVQVYYKPGNITVRYLPNRDNVSGMPENQYVSPGVVKLASNVPQCLDYSFVGWSTNAGATSAEYTPGQQINSHDSITLYAIWQKGEYRLIYDANGGSGAPVTQTLQAPGRITISYETPVRDSCTFLGWNTVKDATSPSKFAGDSIFVDSTIILYAIWESSGPYRISYDAKGGSGAPSEQIKQKDVPINLSTVVPSRSESRYTFAGWAVTSDAQTVRYKPGDLYSDNANVILYAVWSDDGPYDITFSANGGTGAPYPMTKQKGGTVTIPSGTPTRPGYEFKGWVADGKIYMPGDTYSNDADLKLTATWDRIYLNLSLSIQSTTKEINYKDKVNIIATAEGLPDGYSIAIYKDNTLIQYTPAVGGKATLNFLSGQLESKTVYVVRINDENQNTAQGTGGYRLYSEITVNVKTGLFQRILYIFRTLFGLSKPVVIQ